MNPDEILLEKLPAEMRDKLRELSQSLGRTEEDIASEIVQLVIKECDQPHGQELKDFVAKAKLALKPS